MITVLGRQVSVGTLIGYIVSSAAMAGGQIIDWFNKYDPSQTTLVGAVLSAIGIVGFIWNNQTHSNATQAKP